MARNRYRLVQHRGHHRLGRRRVNRPLATLSLRCLFFFRSFCSTSTNHNRLLALVWDQRWRLFRGEAEEGEDQKGRELRVAVAGRLCNRSTLLLRSRFRPRAHFSSLSHSILVLLYLQSLTLPVRARREVPGRERDESLDGSEATWSLLQERRDCCVLEIRQAVRGGAVLACGWEELPRTGSLLFF